MENENKKYEKDLLFISWTSRDGIGKELGEAFTKFFKSFDLGIKVFYSEDTLNDDWYHNLLVALREAKYGFFCLTKSAINSEWVNFELGAILNNKIDTTAIKHRVFLIQLSNSEKLDKGKTPSAFNNVKSFCEKELKKIVLDILEERLKQIGGFDDFRSKNEIIDNAFEGAFTLLKGKVETILKKEQKETLKTAIPLEEKRLNEELSKKQRELDQLSERYKNVEEENLRLKSDAQKLQVKVKDMESQKSEKVVISNETKPTSIILNNPYPFKMIFVPGGTFQMGSNEYDDEKPIHSVTLSDYYLGETQVTQGLWKAVMGDNPSRFKKGDDYPVECVSWNDIVNKFLPELNRQTGKNFCLPTEAQWEFAARGGNKSKGYKYSGSNNIKDVAIYREVSYDLGKNNPNYGTHAVKSKSPNELGIYDMSGNVWEWCQDWYNENYYKDSPSSDPTGPSSGSSRVLRGGSWSGRAEYCRVSYRSGHNPVNGYSDCGMRLALPCSPFPS